MKRIVYFDILNVIACFCVVCMHCNGWIHKFIKDDLWGARVLVEVVCYFAVPVFFMLSGATLLNYRQRYSTTEFYKKRFIRTVIPYLFWGYAIFMFLGYLLANNNYESNNKFFSVLSVACILLQVCRYYLVYQLDEKSEPLFSYFGLYSILPSIWVFLFIKRFAKPLQLDRCSYTWRFLASKSYGVYLLHTFFIVVVEQFIPMNSLLFMTIGVIIIYLLAIFVTFFLQQNKYTVYFIP